MADNQVLDSTYVPTIQPQLAPAWIDHHLRYHDLPLPRLIGGTSFRYIDLGCGLGMTLLCLAAAYPQARFTGIDANPQHIDFARDIATRAGLENIELLVAKFGDPVLKTIPPAHYVVADGIYTWIPQDVRTALIEAFDRMLLPGGTALISANLMPGWLTLLPAQRLLAELAAAEPDQEGTVLVENGHTLIKETFGESRSAFVRKGGEAFEAIFKGTPEGYVVHEYLPQGWQPVWTADLVRMFAAMGCLYIGDTDLRLLRDAYAFTSAQRKLIAGTKTDALRLTLRDVLVPRSFMRLLFHRPAATEALPLKSSRLDGWMALIPEPENVKYECVTTAGRLTFDSPTAHRIIDCLAVEPAKLADISHMTEAPSEDIFLKIIDSLGASLQIMPVDPPQKSSAIDRLNKVLVESGIGTSYRASHHGTPMKIRDQGEYDDEV